MKHLVCHVTSDGYLLGADERDERYNQHGRRYWHLTGDEGEPDCAIEDWLVPDGLADAFASQGTDDQHFSDGYIAHSHLAQYGQKMDSPS